MSRFRFSRLGRITIASALLFAVVGVAGSAGAYAQGNQGNTGAVYVLTNEGTGNRVMAFNRAANGNLTPAGAYATGGFGIGMALGSQGALALSDNGKWLYAVNAASDDVSVFWVAPSGLTLVEREPSGGDEPISLTVSKDLVYVLNAGGNGNISGFHMEQSGGLTPIAGSTRPLSSNAAGPAQVQFSPDGRTLVVTEKMTNTIDTYQVDKSGRASGPVTHASAGTTPFGFAISKQGRVIVSEAFGGMANASALSSYNLSKMGGLNVISASSPTHQTAACWVVITGDGKYTYTTNAGSGTISGYRIAKDGSLSLLNSDGVTGQLGNGSKPLDMALSNNSHYLYALAAGTQMVNAFEVRADGSLTPVQGAGNLPASAAGIAAK
jgi:6-phosphogluconolactonase